MQYSVSAVCAISISGENPLGDIVMNGNLLDTTAHIRAWKTLCAPHSEWQHQSASKQRYRTIHAGANLNIDIMIIAQGTTTMADVFSNLCRLICIEHISGAHEHEWPCVPPPPNMCTMFDMCAYSKRPL